jgi:hypothetical protein
VLSTCPKTTHCFHNQRQLGPCQGRGLRQLPCARQILGSLHLNVCALGRWPASRSGYWLLSTQFGRVLAGELLWNPFHPSNVCFSLTPSADPGLHSGASDIICYNYCFSMYSECRAPCPFATGPDTTPNTDSFLTQFSGATGQCSLPIMSLIPFPLRTGSPCMNTWDMITLTQVHARMVAGHGDTLQNDSVTRAEHAYMRDEGG